MATEQATIIQAITQAAIEATKLAVKKVMAAREEVTTEQRNKATSMRPKIGWPLLTQLTFDWTSANKYAELENFRMELHNIFQGCNISKAEKSVH